MTTAEEIAFFKKRKDMATYQRKITTDLGTAMEYDNEIDLIDRRLEQLAYRFKNQDLQ
jgi:hypothetical protein